MKTVKFFTLQNLLYVVLGVLAVVAICGIWRGNVIDAILAFAPFLQYVICFFGWLEFPLDKKEFEKRQA